MLGSWLLWDFMKRGATIKRKMNSELIIERKMLLLHQVLKLDCAKCVGCGICVSICPAEALKLLPATAEDGRLVKKPLIDFEPTRCTFCGECIVLCLTNALRIEENGKEKVPVVEAEVFPVLLKDVTVDVGKCDPLCSLSCEKECPAEAIRVETEKRGDIIEKILDVEVDKEKCIFCGRCEFSCTKNAFHVKKPIHGVIRLNSSLCPKGCRICVDICPSKAITLIQDEKPSVLDEFCIYCGACQQSCPENAIIIERTRVMHSDIKSGAWITALEKLTSSDSLFKEFGATSARKLHEVASKIDR
jgi:4Fe-4S ferredoxin